MLEDAMEDQALADPFWNDADHPARFTAAFPLVLAVRAADRAAGVSPNGVDRFRRDGTLRIEAPNGWCTYRYVARSRRWPSHLIDERLGAA